MDKEIHVPIQTEIGESMTEAMADGFDEGIDIAIDRAIEEGIDEAIEMATGMAICDTTVLEINMTTGEEIAVTSDMATSKAIHLVTQSETD